jgi:pyridoxamine 5'-phosphate oxidase
VTLDDLARMRENYTMAGLDEADLAGDWVTQFDRWLDQAVHGGVVEPNAMVLATSSRDGVPATRTVLAKAVDERGVVFYTNYTSSKSQDLEENPWAAVTFPWYQLQRQIHVRGRVHRVDEAESLTYWKTRPRSSQIGAWSSPQSTVVLGRAELDRLESHVLEQFPPEREIPLPPHWGGWRIEPVTVEFWQGRTGRMHDRLRYRLRDERWVIERLAP